MFSEILADLSLKRQRLADCRQLSAGDDQIAGLHSRDIRADGLGRLRQSVAELLEFFFDGSGHGTLIPVC